MYMWSKQIGRYFLRVVRRLFSIATRNVIGTITRVTTQEAVVALTFDDGPDPEYTSRLLDILERNKARATFFMTGEAAQQHPELVKRVAHAGHAIGNHSWDHPSFPSIRGRERRTQIRACAQAIAPYGERLFRPPYGEQSILSRIDAFLLGYDVVMFDVCSDDWCGGDSNTIAKQLEERIRPGSVVVLHDRLSDALDDSHFGREAVLEAVETVLDRLGERFRFLTIPELLRHGKAQKEIWYKEADLELLNKLQRREGPGRRYKCTGHGTNRWLFSLLDIQLR
jgi:peptidoglycan/xylan/chitin deacetylase (PgdA/CDA1 family)